jgi:tetratricopeptide (TPR) repeat protein
LQVAVGLKKTLALLGVLNGLWLTAGSAHATPRDDYRELVRRALAAFDLKHWDKARELFSAAHEIEPNARTLRGLGMVAFEMEDFVQAYKLLYQSLHDRRRPLEGALREKTEDLLKRTRLLVGRVRMSVTPDESLVRMDGESVDPTAELWVTIGLHLLTVEARGYETKKISLDIRDGDDQQIEVELEPLDLGARRTASLAPVAVNLTSASAASDDDASIFQKWWFWAAAAGVVAAGVGATLLITGAQNPAEIPPIKGTGGVVTATLSLR